MGVHYKKHILFSSTAFAERELRRTRIDTSDRLTLVSPFVTL